MSVDRLPAWARHLCLLLITAALTMAADRLPGWNIPVEVQPLLAAAITLGLAVVTPLTRQYGVGAAPAIVDPTIATIDVLPTVVPEAPFVEPVDAPPAEGDV